MYFDYPYFPFQRPSELNGPSSHHAVVIVGAGPVGLTCALELARFGIRSVVIDPKSSVCDGSRAVCIARRSMEILQQLGVAERFMSKGLGWTHGKSFYRNQIVYELEMPHSEDERFFPMTNLQQQYIEQFLVEHAAQNPVIELRWQQTLINIEQTAGQTQLSITTPAGDYQLTADYVIAADGARSRVREILGLKLSGEAYEGRYVIADIKLASAYPTERRAFFNPPSNPDSTVLVHKQPDDIWRIDYQLAAHEIAEQALQEQEVKRQIQAVLTMIGETKPWQLQWRSIYKAYTLALDDYRQKNVFFVGDAAHLVPIFGVRGLNSGFADANNLSWKLAAVINHIAPSSLLDSYNEERRAATMDIFREATKSTRFMTPPSRGYQLLRDATLSLSLNNDFSREFINPRQSTPYDYINSSLSSFRHRDGAFNTGPRVGAPLQNQRCTEQAFLLDTAWQGFLGLYFHSKKQNHDKNHDISMPFGTKTISDEAIMEHYGANNGSFYLVRPDGHICARWRTMVADEVLQAQQIALGVQHG